MADRFPLIVDADNTNIKELPSGDNLDLTGSDIVNVVDVTTSGNMVVGGNLTVNGTTTTINSATLTIDDKNIVLASGAADAAAANGAGITIDGASANLLYSSSTDGFAFNKGVTVPSLTTTGNVSFGDNDKAIFGAGGDLEIYHDGSASYIKDLGTGPLAINTNGSEIMLTGQSGSEYMVRAIQDGAVELFHNASKKLATTSTGIDVTGVITTDGMTTSADINFGDNDKAIFGAGSDLQIYHDGTRSYISDSGTGDLRLQASEVRMVNAANTEVGFKFVEDGAASLYFNANEKLATTGSGIDVTGNATFDDNGKAIFGAGSDLQIYHDGSNSYIRDIGTGNLNILADELKIMNASGTENKAFFVSDGGAYLYHNNSSKLETTSTGIDVTGTVTADGLTVDTGSTFALSATLGHTGGSQLFFLSDDGGTRNQIDSQKNSASAALDLATGGTKRQRIDSNGDISFYEDTGSTAKLTWSASNESLTFGTNLAITTNEIDVATGNLTLDVAGVIVLDADNAGVIQLKDAGTHYGSFFTSSDALNIQSNISDGDIIFKGNDGGSGITALTLDMSDAGFATFNNAARATTLQARRQNHGGDVFVSANQTGNAYLDLASTASLILGATSTTTVNSAKIIADHSIGSTGDHRQMLTFHPVAGNSINYEAFRIRDTEIVANETGSAAQDFRVESNSNTHMLFVDAGNNFVGINKSAPEVELHVKSTSAGAMTTFESSSANSSGGPNIRLWRNSASPADGDGLSRLIFQGMNDAAERIDYVEMQTEIEDATDGTEDGLFQIETYVAGTSRNRLRINGTETAFNDGGRNLDFRVESDSNSHMLFVDAGNDRIGVNTSSPEVPVDFAVTSVQIRSDASGANEPKLIFNNDLFAGANHGFIQTSNGGLQLDFEGGSSSTFTGRAKMQLIGGGSRAVSFSTSTDNGSTFVERFKITNTDVIANDTGADQDFRIESDNQTHAIFVDAGNDTVNINRSSGPAALNVQSNSSADGIAVYGRSSDNISQLTMYNSSGTGLSQLQTRPQYFDIRSLADVPVIISPNASGRFYVYSGETVVNENSADHDFRVESDNHTHALFVDASRNMVAVDTSDPDYLLDVGNGTSSPAGGKVMRINSSGDTIFTLAKQTSDLFSIRNNSTIYTALSSNNSAGLMLGYGTGSAGAINDHQFFSATETSFNNVGQDRDFRVESDSNSHMLFVDAGNNRVAVGSTGVTGSQFTVAASTNATIVLDGDSYSTWVQDAQWNSLLLGGAYYDSGAKFAVTNRGASQINIGYDGNATPSLQGFIFSSAAAGGSAGTTPPFENLASITRAGTVFNEDSHDRDFRVESNDNANMIFVDAGSNEVGIGTGNPGATFDVAGTARAKDMAITQDSGYATLEMGGPSGAFIDLKSPDSDDFDGRIITFGSGMFLDVGTGSTLVLQAGGENRLEIDAGGEIAINESGLDRDFRVESDSNTHMLFVDGGNNRVGINQSSPGETFHVTSISDGRSAAFFDPNIISSGAGSSAVTMQIRGQKAACIQVDRYYSHGVIMAIKQNGTSVGSISVTGSTTAYNTSSDARLKENIAEADDAGDLIDAIQVRQFDWIADGEHQRYGMVAQELNTVAPEAVSEGETEDDMMGVDYSKLVPMLIKEIQSLRARVAQLESN